MLLNDLLARMEEAAPKPRPVTLAFGQVYVMPLLVADIRPLDTAEAEGLTQGQRTARNVARLLCDATGQRYYVPDAPEGSEQATNNERLIAAVLRLEPGDLQKINLAMTGGGVDGAKNG